MDDAEFVQERFIADWKRIGQTEVVPEMAKPMTGRTVKACRYLIYLLRREDAVQHRSELLKQCLLDTKEVIKTYLRHPPDDDDIPIRVVLKAKRAPAGLQSRQYTGTGQRVAKCRAIVAVFPYEELTFEASNQTVMMLLLGNNSTKRWFRWKGSLVLLISALLVSSHQILGFTALLSLVSENWDLGVGIGCFIVNIGLLHSDPMCHHLQRHAR